MKNETLKRILSSIVLIPIAFFFIQKGSVLFIFFLGIFFLLTSYEWVRMSKNELIKFLGIVYLFLTSYSAFLLREGDHTNNLYFFLFVIIICISTDVGGYVFGKLFKGPKLTKISPNKTYSGVFGSYFFSVIIAYFFAISKFNIEFNNTQNNNKEFLIVVILISTVSQLGDLIVSYFKRQAKIKNTGKLLPGHGGLLDRVDGIIFAVPIAYLYIIIFN